MIEKRPKYSAEWPTTVGSWPADEQVERNPGEAQTPADRIEVLLAHLTPRQRAVVELRYPLGLEGNPSLLSYRQTGVILGISGAAVRRIEGRAIKRIRRATGE